MHIWTFKNSPVASKLALPIWTGEPSRGAPLNLPASSQQPVSLSSPSFASPWSARVHLSAADVCRPWSHAKSAKSRVLLVATGYGTWKTRVSHDEGGGGAKNLLAQQSPCLTSGDIQNMQA